MWRDVMTDKKAFSMVVLSLAAVFLVAVALMTTLGNVQAENMEGIAIITAPLGDGKTKQWQIDHYPSFSKTNTFSFKTEDGKEVVIGAGYIIEIDLKRLLSKQ